MSVQLGDITDEHFVDGISGNAALNGTPVIVAPLVVVSKPKRRKKVTVVDV